MNTFMTKIIEAEKPFYEGEMTSLIVPAVDGDYGILAMHQNLVIAIIPGLLRFQNPDGEWQEVSVSDGMVRIEDGEVLVLVDSAEWPYEIDIERVKRKEAAARGFDIAMFGHTHRPCLEEYRDVTILNPGSLSYPRQEGRDPSFMLMEFDQYGKMFCGVSYL